MDDRRFDPLEGETKTDGVTSLRGDRFAEIGDISVTSMQWDEYATVNRVPVLVYGERFYGVIDHVPGYLYIATLFSHLYWIPILPLESWICVLDTHGHSGVGHKLLRISLKSICMAWIRAILVGLGFVSGLGGLGGLLTMLAEERVSTLAFTLLSVFAAVFLMWKLLQRLEYAGLERGKQLALRAGFPEDIAEKIGTGELGTPDDTKSPRAWNNEADEPLVPCPNCGRELSPTTRICPRCEWRKT